MQLVDTNVWLALTFQSRSHHIAAKDWLTADEQREFCFCRVTQMGFLRIATNRKAFPADAVPLNQAWQLYEELLTDLHVVYAEEPIGLDKRRRTCISSYLHLAASINQNKNGDRDWSPLILLFSS